MTGGGPSVIQPCGAGGRERKAHSAQLPVGTPSASVRQQAECPWDSDFPPALEGCHYEGIGAALEDPTHLEEHEPMEGRGP